MHVFELWEKSGLPGENPHIHQGDHAKFTQKGLRSGGDSATVFMRGDSSDHETNDKLVSSNIVL